MNGNGNGQWTRWIITGAGVLAAAGIVGSISFQVAVSRELGELAGMHRHLMERLESLEHGETLPMSLVTVAKFHDLDQRLDAIEQRIKENSDRLFRMESRRNP